MNIVSLVGRLTKDPEVKLTSNQTPYCNFTIAVDRRFKDANGNRQADFINCIAWKQTATFIQKYFKKGSKIGVTGSIQTRNYEDQNGQRVYIVEVVIDGAEFVESANSENEAPAAPKAPPVAPKVPITPASMENEFGPKQVEFAGASDDYGSGLPFEI